MKVFVLAAALLIQGPPLPLPQQLNVSQIAIQAGVGVATPAAAQAAPGGGQLPATQLDVDPQSQNQPIEVEVNAGDLRPLLTLLAQAHGLNLLMAPGVSATVTVDLRDVTLEEALQIILTPLGLEYSIEGDFLRVGRPELESRTVRSGHILYRSVRGHGLQIGEHEVRRTSCPGINQRPWTRSDYSLAIISLDRSRSSNFANDTESVDRRGTSGSIGSSGKAMPDSKSDPVDRSHVHTRLRTM